VVRIEADRPLQMGLSLGKFLLSAECHPQHVERAHMVGIDLNRVLQFRHGCRPASLLHQDSRQVEMRVREVGPQLDGQFE